MDGIVDACSADYTYSLVSVKMTVVCQTRFSAIFYESYGTDLMVELKLFYQLFPRSSVILRQWSWEIWGSGVEAKVVGAINSQCRSC